MNTASNTSSRRDEIVTAIGVLTVLIGTATGNAIAMLTLAIVSIGVISIIYRRRIGLKVLFAIVAASSVGFAAVMAITSL